MCDSPAPRSLFRHFLKFLNDLVQIGDLGGRNSAAEGGEHLFGKLSDLAHAPFRSLKLPLPLFVQRLPTQLLQAAQRDRQQLVELMRDVDRDRAERFGPGWLVLGRSSISILARPVT